MECELFISHAWQEGVFEFLAKVRHSWPRSVQTAWCCMLANPQNLDIASFLQSPKSSPFAIALQASKVMLVVPNRQESVYTRLWRLDQTQPILCCLSRLLENYARGECTMINHDKPMEFGYLIFHYLLKLLQHHFQSGGFSLACHLGVLMRLILPKKRERLFSSRIPPISIRF